MNLRRIFPLAALATAALVGACTTPTDLKAIPYGFLTFVTNKTATGYAVAPVGNFYSASAMGPPSEVSAIDSCRIQSYSTAGSVTFGDVYPSILAGSAIQVRWPSRTDSLVPAAVGTGTQYQLKSPLSVPFTPGDSVSVTIPGAAGGYPALAFKAKTTEAFVMQDPGSPAVGSAIPLRWNAAQDVNATMVVSFRYASVGVDSLNAQIYCQFKDDGVDSIPSIYASYWLAATRKTWVATRVRTFVTTVAGGGYFQFWSTFDIPMPAAP
jgi:hypothetical protein